MTTRAIVLDANILVRAVLGSRVSELLAAYAAQATFLAPDIAFEEAREHLPTVLAKRGKSVEAIQAGLAKLEALAHVIVPAPAESYLPFKDRALARIGPRDPEDWPVLACALAADCSIWTEDSVFFGAGVATWTTASVALFFTESAQGGQDAGSLDANVTASTLLRCANVENRGRIAISETANARDRPLSSVGVAFHFRPKPIVATPSPLRTVDEGPQRKSASEIAAPCRL